MSEYIYIYILYDLKYMITMKPIIWAISSNDFQELFPNQENPHKTTGAFLLSAGGR